ncbi:MAG: hypothetical protein E4H01_03640 [Lysobacterales bacterium]|nr:MAG: hypothetical protein E4H01_03640 [Xanthomonadales bacterium]
MGVKRFSGLTALTAAALGISACTATIYNPQDVARGAPATATIEDIRAAVLRAGRGVGGS